MKPPKYEYFDGHFSLLFTPFILPTLPSTGLNQKYDCITHFVQFLHIASGREIFFEKSCYFRWLFPVGAIFYIL